MPRKTRRRRMRACDPSLASMRPRPDAAENLPWYGSVDLASPRFNEAAARCRGKLALDLREERPVRRASMRPRPDAAENAGRPRGQVSNPPRFNEAAARCRGKLQRGGGVEVPDRLLQ